MLCLECTIAIGDRSRALKKDVLHRIAGTADVNRFNKGRNGRAKLA
jgi:hypothetical protein